MVVVHRLDYLALRDEVAPAIRRLVARGPQPGGHPEWLNELLLAEAGRAALVEERYPDHFALRRRGSDSLRKLRVGLGVSLFGDCEELGLDLSLRSDALLRRKRPSLQGACDSTTCAERTACPVHADGQHLVQAETLLSLFQTAFDTRCLSHPSSLAEHCRWEDFRNWYALELGREGATWPESELAVYLDRDPLLRLLLRLSKRGAMIGWADLGPGPGVLGWLAPDETALLAEALDARSLSPPAGLTGVLGELGRSAAMLEVGARSQARLVLAKREALVKALTPTSTLSEMRRALSVVLKVASSAATERAGIALTLR